MLQNTDPEVYQAILDEEKRQANGMELIASENYQSKAVLQAQSSVFANKYAEGFPQICKLIIDDANNFAIKERSLGDFLKKNLLSLEVSGS